jgi:two-component system phosphate regulon sensor histidine kinase PhoR
MNYQELSYLFPFSVSVDNQPTAIVFGLSVLIFFVLIVRYLVKKFDKNEALKYEFITIIAHKFRTPLTHVKWSTDELVKNEPDPYKKRSLQDIQQSNEKLIKLTGTLIELTDSDNTATSSYNFERTSLCSFVRTIGDSCKDAFHEKNIFFSVQCPPDDIFVKIDPQRMEFVLQTLLENALIYTPTGKNVAVIVQRISHKSFVSVTDQGIGIDKKDMSNIFTKFFRADNARATDTEGFGVGLYLAQAITRRHKGRIDVDSAGIGAGSTFTVTLRVVK